MRQHSSHCQRQWTCERNRARARARPYILRFASIYIYTHFWRCCFTYISEPEYANSINPSCQAKWEKYRYILCVVRVYLEWNYWHSTATSECEIIVCTSCMVATNIGETDTVACWTAAVTHSSPGMNVGANVFAHTVPSRRNMFPLHTLPTCGPQKPNAPLRTRVREPIHYYKRMWSTYGSFVVESCNDLLGFNGGPSLILLASILIFF